MELWVKYDGGIYLRKANDIYLEGRHIVVTDNEGFPDLPCYIEQYTTVERAKEVFDNLEKFITSSDPTKTAIYELPIEGSVNEEESKRWREYYEKRNMLD